ncbi:hypothetical protein, partial [Chryseobacterium sp. CH25]|uniref:hypothetical protein n=1 Tax=Chryseobacterium sp. CH25 TaxID=713559 RepID=UPI001E41D7F0
MLNNNFDVFCQWVLPKTITFTGNAIKINPNTRLGFEAEVKKNMLNNNFDVFCQWVLPKTITFTG